MYRVSYMTYEIVGRARRGCQRRLMSVASDEIALMQTFTLVPRGPFSLAASIKFLGSARTTPGS